MRGCLSAYSGLDFGLPSQTEAIAGDFNGDGKTDYARLDATGAWIFPSTGVGFTQLFQAYDGLDFGLPSDWVAITADFNGDGKSDYARLGSTGAWIFSGNGDSPLVSSFHDYDGLAFGLPSQWQTIAGAFSGGTKSGYARLGGTSAWVFRAQ